MQKISSYLYPNRINVVADVTLFTTRWNIVYQNRIKIYQGVDNVLTIDVKNADQKRIDISEMDLRMIVTDTAGQLVSNVTVTPTNVPGIATAIISEQDLASVEPQFLSFSVYRVNDDSSKTVLYADTQFGAKGNVELVGNIMDVAIPERYIAVFSPITDPGVLGPPPYAIIYYSDAVEITQPNFIKPAEDDQVNFEFRYSGLEGTVVLQFTKDPVISSATAWQTIETFTVVQTSITETKSYTVDTGYNREMTWARVYYIPATGNTGKIDRIVVTL